MPRIVINCPSIDHANRHIVVQEARAWGMTDCQQWQNRFHKKTERQRQRQPKKQERKQNGAKDDSDSKNTNNNGHGAGIAKRFQGEHLAEFLISMIVWKLRGGGGGGGPDSDDTSPPLENLSNWSMAMSTAEVKAWRARAIHFLNKVSGVVDVAGGSGHVSMALGLLGVKSTVVDARARVGMAASQSRSKNLESCPQAEKRSGKPNQENVVVMDPSLQNYEYCQPVVVPYQTHRSCSGFRPVGVDSSFRHPDEDNLPTWGENPELIRNASAIVALHPDEATTDAVRIAVKRIIPFLIIPCCVFARLFPDRCIASSQEYVSTYEQLLRYLLEQDSSIRKHQLVFEGGNIALWSLF
jgi:hypothetical protein